MNTNRKNRFTPTFEALENRELMSASGLGLLVPAYNYPTFTGAADDTWTRLTAAAHKAPVTAILNPDSGPGAHYDSNYDTAVTALQRAGGKAIGYVDTAYGTIAPTTVLNEINNYRSWYHVNGVFLDDFGSRNGTADEVGYYQQVYQSIQNLRTGLTVVGNPGTDINQAYAGTADTLVEFERGVNGDNTGPGYLQRTPPAWETAPTRAPGQNAAIVLAVPDAATMQRVVAQAASQNTGCLYVTNGVGGTAYDNLPPYWDQLVTAVASTPVQPTAPPLNLGALPVTTGNVNQPFNVTVPATGGVGNRYFIVASGTLPAGLQLTGATGNISGTPTKAGTFTFLIQAQDASGQLARGYFTLVINNVQTAPVRLTTFVQPTTTPFFVYQGAFATGGSGSYSFTYQVQGKLPAGLQIYRYLNEVYIYGQMQANDSNAAAVIVTVTDSTGGSNTVTLSVVGPAYNYHLGQNRVPSRIVLRQ